MEGQIHVLVNDERRRAALTVLTLDSKLSDVARAHSSDMAMHSFFDHDNPSGQSPSSRAANAGYKCFKDYGTYYTEGIAENIFQTWLRSSTTYMYGLPVG
ncbi:MAG TPA: CAP domain-containing protein, partial [Dehalococcoidia bacterium]|nr:CAP domain-containing protein [Dehalococcoidia bacterium]